MIFIHNKINDMFHCKSFLSCIWIITPNFSNINYRAFPTKIASYRQKNTYESVCVTIKDKHSAIKLYDALCISNLNISGIVSLSSLHQYWFSLQIGESALGTRNGAFVINDREPVSLNSGVGIHSITKISKLSIPLKSLEFSRYLYKVFLGKQCF